MKKALLTAFCLLLIGCLTIGGTLASDLSVTEWILQFFQSVDKLLDGNESPSSNRDQFRVTVSEVKGSALLFPGTSATITNTVKNESTEKAAYFRLYYAVPKNDKITVGFSSNVTLSKTIETDTLRIYALTYNATLQANASVSVSVTVAFNSDMTDAEFAKYSGGQFLKTQVFAIEAEAFAAYDSITDALNAALPLDTNPFN